jgi:DNA recombination protein RmuC
MNDHYLALLIGLAVGAAIGWYLGRKASPATTAALDGKLEAELRGQIEILKKDAAGEAAQRLEAEKGRSAAEATASASERRISEERAGFHRDLSQLKADHTAAIGQLKDSFAKLSGDALKEMQPAFLKLATGTLDTQLQTAKGDLENRQTAIAALLKPVETLLTGYQTRLADSEKAQSEAIGAVKKQLESLTTESSGLAGETQQLRLILSSNSVRGMWGEETLRRVCEASGMSAHCDFVEQAQSEDKKPDLLVKLPGNRVIIVDSKVPDLDFLNVLNKSDGTSRVEVLAAHADKMRATIKALADRNYPAQFPNSLDHVVLFLPAESLFSAALEGDPELILWAAKRNITLTTPASLIALLRAVSVSWLQHQQTENARDINEAATELYSRVATLVKHFDSIRAGLNKATDSFNDAVGSYERSVRPKGEELLRLGIADSGKTLPAIELLNEPLRTVVRGTTTPSLPPGPTGA